jgi:lipoprotein-anchoring transpeptidase ErfK/SrfK
VKTAALAVVALVALASAGGAGGLYAYDSSRERTVAEGVTIAGVDVGGLRADRARAVLEREIVEPLERPLRTWHGKRVFVLTAEDAGVRVDVDGMVAEALDASRDVNFLARAWRDLTGGTIRTSVPLRVAYSPSAVRAFAAGVERALSRPPRAARVSYTVARIRAVPAKTGIEVENRRLRRELASRLVRPHSDRAFHVPMRATAPKVTTRKLRREFSHFITISRTTKTLRLFVNFRLARKYEIAVGQIGYETPGGLYHVQNKAVNPAWHVPDSPWAGALAGRVIPGGAPDNPLVARWLGFYNGAGIHGTNDPGSIGQAASHGCIRMRIPDVIDLYPRVPVGTPLYIV